MYKGKSTRPQHIIKWFRSWCTTHLCFASLLRCAFERMRNRQMKLRGEHTPRCVPNGLNVWPAFKFSITQFTSIYLLEWPALPFIPKIYHCTHTHRTRCLLLQKKWHTCTQKHVQADGEEVIESQCLSCGNVCVCVYSRWAQGRGGKQERVLKKGTKNTNWKEGVGEKIQREMEWEETTERKHRVGGGRNR